MRILHLADVHLDRPFVDLPLPAARARRHELRDAFDRCVRLAVERRADLVTIGGDLWEDEHVTPDTSRWVADRLGSLGVPVVMIAGNHDPLAPGGVHERTTWPANVTLLPAAELTETSLGDLSVWGMSWGRFPLTAEALDAFRVPRDGRSHVLLLHGTASSGLFGDAGHCPFQSGSVSRAGFALCLAGHLHRAGVADGVIYPGSPEPLGWGEDGRHAIALVDVGPGREVSVELIDVNRRRYRTAVVDCDGADSSAELERRLRAHVAQAAGDRPEGLCLRAELHGRVHRDCRADGDALARGAAGALALLDVRDMTRPAFDLDAYAGQPTVLGEFVRELSGRREGAGGEPEAARITLALELGLRAIHDEDLTHAA